MEMKVGLGVVLFLLFAPVSAIVAQSTTSASTASTSDLKFSVTAGKATYLRYEPIVMRFKLRNPTNKDFVSRTTAPQFFQDSKLEITNSEGETSEVNTLSLAISHPEYSPLAKFEIKAGDKYEMTGFAAIDPALLAAPGKYTLRLTYKWRFPPDETLSAPPFEITILEPTGRDKAAFEFLSKNGKDVFFHGVDTPKNRDEVLQTFVRQYSDTGYGEYGIFALSSYYAYSINDKSRAKAELEKLLSSQNPYLAKRAAERLKELK